MTSDFKRGLLEAAQILEREAENSRVFSDDPAMSLAHRFGAEGTAFTYRTAADMIRNRAREAI